jgi:hypothetical protein
MSIADPTVSVVVGVHNAADAIRRTVASVLAQDDVTLELVIVDDGSTDDTAARLDAMAIVDPRLRVVRLPRNEGLTAALIKGCATARGKYIARQDADDLSLPGRLAEQAAWLDAHPSASLVSCHTRVLGLYGETVYEHRIAEAELRDGLLVGRDGSYSGPTHHGSVMMRASAYRAVGGYRSPFVVAQDLDLWLRLAEVGEVGIVDLVGYAAQASPTGISAQRAGQQKQLAALAARLAIARRAGVGEQAILAEHAHHGTLALARAGALQRRLGYAAHTYFLGRCIRARDPRTARRYFLKGLRHCPWHLRSWYGLATSWL